MKITIGKAVIECNQDELPSVLKHLNSQAKASPPAPAVKPGFTKNGKKIGRPKGRAKKTPIKDKVSAPVVKRLTGVTELLMQHVLENKVPLPFGNEGIVELARLIYGSDSRDSRGKIRSLLDYHMKRGTMKRVGPGEYDLT